MANYRYFMSGGPERYLFNLEAALQSKGHEVIPFSVRYPQNAPSAYDRYFVEPLDTEGGVYFEDHSHNLKTTFRTLRRLFYDPEVEKAASELIVATKPDVAYVLHYLRKLSPALLVAIKKAGIPLMVRLSDFGMVCPQIHCLRQGKPCTKCVSGSVIHSVRYRCVKNSATASTLAAISHWFYRWQGYFDLVDKFIVTNRFTYEMMCLGGIDPTKLVVLETFGDLNTFSPLEATVISDPTIAYVGRLDHQKGIEILLEAFAASDKLARLGAKLVIAGHGRTDYVERLKTLVRPLSSSNRIRFIGELAKQDVARLLAGSSICVVPSLSFENLPNVVIESLACGTPLLVSRVGALPDFIEEGVTGLSFDSGNTIDLKNRLEAAMTGSLRDPDKRDACRRAAEIRFSEDNHIHRLLGLFEHLLYEGRQTPSPAGA